MHATERAALIRLTNTLGAEITLSLAAYEPLPRSRRAHLRYACEPGVACWPGDSVVQHAKVAVLTPVDFPTNQRSMLRSSLAQSGLEVRDDCAWITCGATRHEIADALVAADAPSVLLVGGDAVGFWRADVLMKQVVGGLYPARLGGSGVARLTGVIESPGAVLRGSVDGKQWRLRLARFVDCVLDRTTDDADKLTYKCMAWDKKRERVCGDVVHAWDVLGLPWCRLHLEKGWDAGVRGDVRGKRLANRELQGSML
jgi:hypothetical protein